MSRKLKNILVTGGAGFIGTNFIYYLFRKTDFSGRIINVDLLTYAGNLENLEAVEAEYGVGGAEGKAGRYVFEHADICDAKRMEKIMRQYDIDTVVHFAAESHVDRSILGPEAFLRTNVTGTFTLLEAVRTYWTDKDGKFRDDVLFHHISTDEVYGSLGKEGYFKETTPYSPRSPYSASKASSDHLVMAYHHTYGLPVTLSNCSNNYGPFQFPEKLIPLMILNMQQEKPLPVYGDGKFIRDWLYVEDHNSAVWMIMNKGRTGEKYNIGGENEWENIRLLEKLIEIVALQTGKSVDSLKKLITYVKDRPGHDRRYAIDCSKLKSELGWKQAHTFEEGLQNTVEWYLSHNDWISHIRNGEYTKWLENNYQNR
ncbi:MAG: dTDP-glucose 4,6-dehydratase [Spirochaetaceae bacterium]|nr:dTDP-glucose 4,6-dehydratase [Spirochaetaceae bacterium]